jgi:hypothetical protein
LEPDLLSYLQNYSWGSDNLDEKISCTFNVFVQSATGDNKYVAQVFIGSQRPIYGSQQNTAVLRLFDESWEFTYVKDRPLDHNPYVFNDLASFLDFYVYTIIACDYDTWDRLGGTPYFNKAADIASLARSSGQKGWEGSFAGYSRTRFLREILSAQFEPIRVAIWKYHFAGLDSLAFNKPRALQNIVDAVESMGAVAKTAEAQNSIIKTFFETKYMEIANLLQEYPDRSIYARLSKIDPFHQTTYEQYRTGRR